MKTLIFLCLLPISLPRAQGLDFFREDLTFHLDHKYFSVEGYYWFANTGYHDLTNEIFYPFP